MKDTRVFVEKYESCLSKIRFRDVGSTMKCLGGTKHGQTCVFDFFNRQIAFNGDDFLDVSGCEVVPAFKFVLCNYILKSPLQKNTTSKRMVTFREFSNAGPLFSRFSENTGKIISTSFSGHVDQLKQRCRHLGATLLENPSYDLSAKFRALDKVPIFLNYNDADDLMPANTIFLFYDNAESYLDLDALTIVCTYLTGLLIQER
jgi:hypothetical protein